MPRTPSLGLTRPRPRGWRILLVAALVAAVVAVAAVVSAPSRSVAATVRSATLSPIVSHDVETGYDRLPTDPTRSS
jgi:hypothetical protein